MIRLTVALFVLLLASLPAAAASFDCGKAQTSIEKAVCADDTLGKLDEVLVKAYGTALGGLSEAAAGAVKAGQRAWLDYASRACGVDGNPLKGSYDADQTACLQTVYRTRISGLEASRMLGLYRFYPEETWLVEKDTEAEADAFNKVADKHFATVKIDGGEEDEFAASFNQMTEDMRLAFTDYFPKGQVGFARGNVTEDADISTVVKSATDYRISLETNAWFYGHGAAHGNYTITHNHFLVAEARPLVAEDIFAGEGWQDKLKDLAIERAKAQLGDGYFPDGEADMLAWVADPTRWDFSADGLTLQFQPYEVGPYAAGAVTVLVRWDEIRDFLTENGEAIGAY